MDPVSRLSSVRSNSAHISQNDWDMHISRQLRDGPRALNNSTYGAIEKYVKTAMSNRSSGSPKGHMSEGEVHSLIKNLSSKRELYHLDHKQMEHIQHTLLPFVK